MKKTTWLENQLRVAVFENELLQCEYDDLKKAYDNMNAVNANDLKFTTAKDYMDSSNGTP
jgi:hypothetical protein